MATPSLEEKLSIPDPAQWETMESNISEEFEFGDYNMVPGKVDTEIKEASKILLGSNEQKSPEIIQPGTVKITPMDPVLATLNRLSATNNFLPTSTVNHCPNPSSIV